jgi:hypothetical protein
MCAVADVLTGVKNYPSTELREGWELLLLNQFHDILPGSSIRQVYEDAREQFVRIQEIGTNALESAKWRVGAHIQFESESVLVFNSLSWPRTDLIELPWSDGVADKTVLDETGAPSPVQIVEADAQKKILLQAPRVPALGYQAFPLTEDTQHVPRSDELLITPTLLQNRFYRIELNSHGQITSLFDRINEREVLAPGARGNVLQAFEDKPLRFDAWDIDIYYQQKGREVDDLVEAAVERWGEPDAGIWEWPGKPKHFVHSKALCWAAVDRGLRLAEECMRKAPEQRWRKARNEIREAVESEGYDSSRGVFVQAFGAKNLDAALLLLPTVEFLDYDDERMIRTADAIREELDDDGLIRRYDVDDSLNGREGAFLACSFWLAECYANQHRLDEAREVFDRAVACANELGLFSEEWDTRAREMTGNFPQGLTHLALINAAVSVHDAEREEREAA